MENSRPGCEGRQASPPNTVQLWLRYPNEKDRRKHKAEFQLVRVVEYKLLRKAGAAGPQGEETYRLITTILEPGFLSASVASQPLP